MSRGTGRQALLEAPSARARLEMLCTVLEARRRTLSAYAALRGVEGPARRPAGASDGGGDGGAAPGRPTAAGISIEEAQRLESMLGKDAGKLDALANREVRSGLVVGSA